MDKIPPPIDYQTPSGPPRNSPGMFFRRMLIGTILALAGAAVGRVLANATGMEWMAFPPMAAALGIAIFMALRHRKYGYVTGVIMGPFIITACLIGLLMIVCGVVGRI